MAFNSSLFDGSLWPGLNATMLRDSEAVNCKTLINPSNATIVFDVGWQAIPETIVFNLILFFVSTICLLSLLKKGFVPSQPN